MAQDSVVVLVVEDDLDQARLVSAALSAAEPSILVVHVPALAPALQRLAQQRFDAVLAALDLPDSTGLDTLVALQRSSRFAPVVALIADAEGDTWRAALRGGADDVVMRAAGADPIVQAVRKTIERARARGPERDRLQLLNAAGALLVSVDQGDLLSRLVRLVVSERFGELCLVARVASTGQADRVRLAHVDPDVEQAIDQFAAAHRGAVAQVPADYLALSRDGPARVVDGDDERVREAFLGSPGAVAESRKFVLGPTIVVPVTGGAGEAGVMLIAAGRGGGAFDRADVLAASDLARHVSLALEKRSLLREARELFDTDLIGQFVATLDGALTDCNPAFARMLGYADAAGPIERGALAIFGGDVNWREFVAGLIRDRRVRQHEVALRRSDGTAVHVLVSATGLFGDAGTLRTIRGQLFDLTAHKQLEEQLSQSQKMEAVGRLAGGIAHDFNNLLMIIGGQTARVLEQLSEDSALRHNAEAVASAAERAAGLTQQLLAFSRRQVLSPQIVSLNAVVRNLHGMLERVIGEDVTCILTLAEGIENVKADPGRIEQALLNLAVNARDAMPGGGTLSISTAVVDLDAVYCRQHVGSRPGRYVRLAVSDTGCGMDPETRTRVFEPFFTTKEVGKGTGLGLSMVYGIVKQSGGYIWVYSELGIGTTFKIYLPTTEQAADPSAPRVSAASVPKGSETVLLVEDEDDVRALLEETLVAQGYRVLAAGRGIEALQVSELLEDTIDVLVTDVVMPQMSGHELAMRLRARRPALRVLYLSGYTDEAIAHHGVIAVDAAFLQKPFSLASLATKLREVLAPRGEGTP